MNRLVRLYPKAWRERYEAEFIALLAERPPTIRDAFDVARGAADAHLHPEVAAGDVAPSPWTHRVPGFIALTGGLLWSANILFLTFWADLERDWATLVPLATIFMFLSLPGDYMAMHGRRIAVAFAALGICVIAANLLPYWPLGGVVALAGYLLALGGMLTLGAIRAGIGSRIRWLLLVLTVVLPLAISVPVAVGVVAVDQSMPLFLLVLLPYGTAWALVGLRMAIRGAPTIVDPPLNPIQPEVRAA